MQKVTGYLPSWGQTKAGSKKGFDKAWQTLDKLGAPVNKFSNKIGSEAFWPTTLDKESDKAARILKSFCKDGFYAEEERPATVGVPKGKQRVLKKIPQKVIQNAVGLAIFTTMRTGLWISGAGGSGVLIARKENGEWSPPSGILLHTAGLGFLVGVDIYDCVVVINNRKALDSFTKIRATIGGEISAVAGPAGIGGVLENDGKWKQANRPVFTYLKSRGFYAGVQVDGTVIIERTDENERFYGQRIGVADILAGKVRHPPYEIKRLMETVKAAEGRYDVDSRMVESLDNEPAPGDCDISSPASSTFGIPDSEDPDPFGVLALEKAGLEIREAGTKSRPPSSQFEYNPSPTSPVYTRFNRRSIDTFATGSNRESYMSGRSHRTTRSIDAGTQTMEMGTQTEDPVTPSTSPTISHDEKFETLYEKPEVLEPPDVDYTKIDLGPYNNLNHSQEFDGTTVADSPRHDAEHDNPMADELVSEDELDEEEPVIFEVASTQAQIISPKVMKARGGLVNIPKRPPPPPLPPRSSARTSRTMVDRSTSATTSPATTSPVKSEFEEVDLHAVNDSNRGSVSSAVDPSSRSSVGSTTGIVMQDLEVPEKEEVKSVAEDAATDEKVELASEEQNGDLASPSPHDAKPVIDVPTLSEESNEIKAEPEPAVAASVPAPAPVEEEKEEFHSVATTPNEIQVEVK